jgi:hypothetical protein
VRGGVDPRQAALAALALARLRNLSEVGNIHNKYSVNNNNVYNFNKTSF